MVSQIAYSANPVTLIPASGIAWLPGTLTPVANGYVVVLPSGEVLSVQPNGTLETRPPGTTGEYEVCQVSSSTSMLIYGPQGVHFNLPFRGI